MFSTPAFSSRYRGQDPKYLQLALLRQALDAGSVPSHCSVPPPHNDGSHWIEFLQSSPIPQILSPTPSSVPSHQFLPPCRSFLADHTPEFSYSATHGPVGASVRHISGCRPPQRSPPKIPKYVFSSPGHNGFAVIESLQSSPIPPIFPRPLNSNGTHSTRSNVTGPPRSKPWRSSRRLFHERVHPSHSSHLFHSPYERDDILEEPISSSLSGCTPVSALSNHTSRFTAIDSVWPDAVLASPPTQHLSSRLPPRQSQSIRSCRVPPISSPTPSSDAMPSDQLPRESHPIRSSHRLHPQHERDYVFAKSISSSRSGGTPVPALSNQTSKYTAVKSVRPDGPPEWLFEPLPPRSRPFLSNDDVFASPETQSTEVESLWADGPTPWFSEPLPPPSPPLSLDDAVLTPSPQQDSSLQDAEIKITIPSVTCMDSPLTAACPSSDKVFLSTSRRRHLTHLISSPHNSYSASPFVFFLPPKSSVQLSLCAFLMALLLLAGFLLMTASLSFLIGDSDAAHELHPGRRTWHVMVP